MGERKESSSKSSTPSRTSSGAVHLVLIQVVSRALTFAANQVLLRQISPHDFGLAIQLEALSVSVLYTARESLRVAIQRQPLGSRTDLLRWRTSAQEIVNLAYLVICTGFFLAFVFGGWYLHNASTEVTSSTDFGLTFQLYAFATFAELICEPSFVIVQQHGRFDIRARAETIGALSRCVCSCLTAFYMQSRQMKPSTLSFGVGQLAYGVSLLSTYYTSVAGLVSREGFSLVPRAILDRSETVSKYYFSYLSRPLLGLVTAFYGQSLFKWILTQGDTLVMSLFAELQSQGIFALASNYGGLVSRLLLQPIEESSRNVFGRFMSGIAQRPNVQATASKPHPQAASSKSRILPQQMDSAVASSPSASPTSSTQTADRPPKKFADVSDIAVDPNSSQALEALNHLATILRAYLLLIGLPCITIVPRLFPFVVRILLGSNSQWSKPETFKLLSVYSYYLPFLAINGVLDAFVTSAASEAELGLQSIVMAAVTAIYLIAAWLGLTLSDIGATSLVYANILGMTLRIAFSLWFIRTWVLKNVPENPQAFQKLVKSSVPDVKCLASILVVLFVLQGGVTSKEPSTNNPLEISQLKMLLQRSVPSFVQGSSQSLMSRLPSRIVDSIESDSLLELAKMTGGLIVLGSAILFTEYDFLIQFVEPFLSKYLKSRIPIRSHKSVECD